MLPRFWMLQGPLPRPRPNGIRPHLAPARPGPFQASALALALAAPIAAEAASYHIAARGDDSRTPLQARDAATPWRTPAPLAALSLQPGDSILLRRGDTLRASIVLRASGSEAAPIVVGAYGEGPAPILSGTAVVQLWRRHAGSIFVADLPADSGRPEQLFLDGRPLRLARHPNSGYIPIDSVESGTRLRIPTLAGGAWSGAAIHVRSARWSLDARAIASFDAATGWTVLDRAANYDPHKGWGVFVNAALPALDTAGEWHYDSAQGRIYAWLPGGEEPAGHRLEASIRRVGIDVSSRRDIRVEDLRIFGQTDRGIGGASVQRIAVRRCSIEMVDARGIDLSGSAISVEDNSLRGANVGAIMLSGSDNRIAGNRITETGAMTRLGRRGLGGGCCTGRAISASGARNTFAGNTIDSTGYIGINFSGIDNLVEGNVIDNSCLTVDDGAGIYTWASDYALPGSSGSVIRGNIVLHGRGNLDGTPGGEGQSHGIYLDDRSHGIRVEGNTVAWNHRGIFLHNTRDVVATGNVAYGNAGAQIVLSRDAIVAGDMFGNSVEGNTLHALSASAPCASVTVHVPNATPLGSLSANVCCQEDPLRIDCRRDGAPLWNRYFIDSATIARGANIVPNGDFDSALGWAAWPSFAKPALETGARSYDGRSLRLLYTGDTVARNPALYPARTFAIEPGGWYWLRFRAAAAHAGTLTAILRRGSAPWTHFGFSRIFPVDTAWTEQQAFFRTTGGDPVSRIDFANSAADSLYWLDEVRLVGVDSSLVQAAPRSRLLVNATAQAAPFAPGTGQRAPDGSTLPAIIEIAARSARIAIPDPSATVTARPGAGGRPAVRLRMQAGRVRFLFAEAEDARIIALRDPAGRLVAEIAAASREVEWQARGAAAGIYLAEIRSRSRRQIIPVVLVR